MGEYPGKTRGPFDTPTSDRRLLSDLQSALLEQKIAQENAKKSNIARGIAHYVTHDSIPARGISAAISGLTLPGDVYAGRANAYDKDEMVRRSTDLAGLLTLGAGAMPGAANELRAGYRHGSVGRGNVGRRSRFAYHRYSQNKATPENEAGWSMFLKTRNPEDVSGYGRHHWGYSGKGAKSADDIVDLARKAGFEDEFYSADLINPDSVINSAGAWDDPDAVEWLWNNVLEPNKIKAVTTQDGAVIFDPNMAQYLGKNTYR